MKLLALLFSLLASLLLSGCYLEERMFFSPDGSQVLLRREGKLHFAPADKLEATTAVVDGEDYATAAWLPDGSGFFAVRTRDVAWPEFSKCLTEEELKEAEAMSGILEKSSGSLHEILKALNDMAQTKSLSDDDPLVSLYAWSAPAMLHLAHHHPAALKTLMGNEEENLAGVSKLPLTELTIVELKDGRPGEPRVIGHLPWRREHFLRKLRFEHEPPTVSICVHPNKRVAAWSVDTVLMVSSADGAFPSREISGQNSGTPCWTKDGQGLVFVQRSDSWKSLVTLRAITVFTAAGKFEPQEAVSVAGTLCHFPPRLFRMPDGRVLFPTQKVVPPPWVGEDVPLDGRFCLYDPSKSGVESLSEVPTAAGALPSDLVFYAPSPDGHRIAVGESSSDLLAMVEVATGKVEEISPKRTSRCRTLPSWRNATECYFTRMSDATPPTVQLAKWKAGEGVTLVQDAWDGNWQELPQNQQ